MSDHDDGLNNRIIDSNGMPETMLPQNGWADEYPDQTVTREYERLMCICGEEFEQNQDVQSPEQSNGSHFIVLTCGHVRCVECLNTNIRVGLENSFAFPPFCHQCREVIEVGYFTDYLSDEVIARYTEIKDEFADSSPLFCGKKECSKYLKRNCYYANGRWATCATCTTKTCIQCAQSAEAHAAIDTEGCPDGVDKASRDLMNRLGWKECPFCRQMIEKTEGCLHMICVCGSSFCYGCGIAGFECDCANETEWVEDINNLWNAQQLDELAELRAHPVSINSEEFPADWPEYSTPTDLDWAQEMARQLGTRPLNGVVEDTSWSESTTEDREEVPWDDSYEAVLREIRREASGL